MLETETSEIAVHICESNDRKSAFIVLESGPLEQPQLCH